MLDKDGLPIPLEGAECDVEYCLIKRTPYVFWIADPRDPKNENKRVPKYHLETTEALSYLGVCRRTLIRHADSVPVATGYMKLNDIKTPNLYADTVLKAYKESRDHPDFDEKTGQILEKPLSETDNLKKMVEDLQKKLEAVAAANYWDMKTTKQ